MEIFTRIFTNPRTKSPHKFQVIWTTSLPASPPCTSLFSTIHFPSFYRTLFLTVSLLLIILIIFLNRIGLSHVRSGVYLKDGRWRQYEAYDCQDVDSVHNDFQVLPSPPPSPFFLFLPNLHFAQRQLPYVLFFPNLLMNQIEEWAKLQLSNGMIQETLAAWGDNGATLPLDTGGGRVMADVTSGSEREERTGRGVTEGETRF
jgi:hypothetical protein